MVRHGQHHTHAQDWQRLFSFAAKLIDRWHMSCQPSQTPPRDVGDWEWLARIPGLIEWRRDGDQPKQWQGLAGRCLSRIDGHEEETFKLFINQHPRPITLPHLTSHELHELFFSKEESFFGDDFIRALSRLSPSSGTFRVRLLRDNEPPKPQKSQTGISDKSASKARHRDVQSRPWGIGRRRSEGQAQKGEPNVASRGEGKGRGDTSEQATSAAGKEADRNIHDMVHASG